MGVVSTFGFFECEMSAEPMTIGVPHAAFNGRKNSTEDSEDDASTAASSVDLTKADLADMDDEPNMALEVVDVPNRHEIHQSWVQEEASWVAPMVPACGLVTPGTSEVKTQFRKTRVCRYFANGFCHHGASCRYAHHAEELHSAPDLNKTKLCFKYFRGECANENCNFAHGYSDLRATTSLFKTELCFQFRDRGFCKAGSSCRYAHGDDELRPPGF